MGLESDYPALAKLVGLRGHTLARLADTPPAEHLLLNLSGACYLVHHGMPRHGAPDAYDYLRTLESFLQKVNGSRLSNQRRFLNKLLPGNGSSFLDTIVEAAWASYFIDLGYPTRFEEPLEPQLPRGKDADIYVEIDGNKYWLDAVATNLTVEHQHEGSDHPLLTGLANKALYKYRKKFHAARVKGAFTNASVGILLCVLKVEERVLPHLLPHLPFNDEIPAPKLLFASQNDSPDLVYVHTLRREQSSDILRPFILMRWSRHASYSPYGS